MPHLEDDWFDLPEYPVRPVAPRGRSSAAGGRPASVWVRYPMGSRIVAALTVTLLLAPVVAFFRGDGSGSASAAADTGLVVSDAADASAGLAADGSAVTAAATVAAASEGTLPGTVATAATLPRTTPTTPPATAAPRKTASQSSAVQVVKPPVTTKAPAKSTTSAKAVVKPATSGPATTKPTTAATAVVKPPATATTPRTTRPQAVATTAATAAPAHEWTTDEVQALIRQMWPADSVDKAMQVANRESRFRATVYNGWCCYGVFQINGSSHLHRLRARGLGVQDLLDPKVNIEIALELFQEQGWGPWGG